MPSSSPRELPQIADALAATKTIDIETIGRRSGVAHRQEIWFYRIDGTYYLTGWPGRRDWVANLLARPQFTVHVRGASAPALARQVTDADERRRVITRVAEIESYDNLEAMLAASPVMAFTLV